VLFSLQINEMHLKPHQMRISFGFGARRSVVA
jgi:hypothetical protein